MKPKYSPYNKLQRNPSILAVSIFISHHCLGEFVTLGTPTAQRQEHDRPDASAASFPLQAVCTGIRFEDSYVFCLPSPRHADITASVIYC